MSLRFLRAGLSSIHTWSPIRPHALRTLRTRTTARSDKLYGPPRLSRILLISGAALATTLAGIHFQGPLYADSVSGDEERHSLRQPTPLSALVRSYAVYTACSIPGLVDWSPKILSTMMSIPGLKQITEAVVRVTFFDQFVGGDTALATLPVLKNLRAENKGCLFAYSVEVDEAEAEGNVMAGEKQPVHKRIVQEMIRCIDVAADFEDEHAKGKGRRTWVALKLTALIPNASSLISLSKHIVESRSVLSVPVAFPGKPRAADLDILRSETSRATSLTLEDFNDLRELHADLVEICTHAEKRGIKIVIDAEHSWYQPAIDAFGLALMRQFNKIPNNTDAPAIQPLVYVTFQAYLRRNKDYLLQSLADAKSEGYVLGVKLVRGAYHPHETKSHETRRNTAGKTRSLSISPDDLPPVWPIKPDTDACYNECVKILIDEVAKDVNAHERRTTSLYGLFRRTRREKVTKSPSIGVLFGSHNWDSIRLVLDSLVEKRLASVVGLSGGEAVMQIDDDVAERVTMAQLYGMCDSLTNYIVDRTRSSSPVVLKYVPYGALVEVLPYLSRRAIENKFVLGDGGAATERRAAAAGIRAKIFG